MEDLNTILVDDGLTARLVLIVMFLAFNNGIDDGNGCDVNNLVYRTFCIGKVNGLV